MLNMLVEVATKGSEIVSFNMTYSFLRKSSKSDYEKLRNFSFTSLRIPFNPPPLIRRAD